MVDCHSMAAGAQNIYKFVMTQSQIKDPSTSAMIYTYQYSIILGTAIYHSNSNHAADVCMYYIIASYTITCLLQYISILNIY